MKAFSREGQIIRTSVAAILTNLALALCKLLVGLATGSIAIVLDAVNNASDMLSSLVTVIGTRIASRPADREHPYGHGRMEYLSAALISAIVLYAGITALIESVKKLLSPVTPQYSALSLVLIALAVLAKCVLGLYVTRQGKRLDADTLRHSGRDALLDALISASTLVAALVFLAFSLSLEAWLGLVIALVIVKAGVDMFRETVSKILGERADGALTKAVRRTITETPGISGAYDLTLSSYGPEQWIGSVHIEVPETWTAARIDAVSREIASRVFEKNHVVLSAIGIYSHNASSGCALQMENDVRALVMAQAHVLQMHGFYCDPEAKTARFDIVIDFVGPEEAHVYDAVQAAVQAAYPDYTFTIRCDASYAD